MPAVTNSSHPRRHPGLVYQFLLQLLVHQCLLHARVYTCVGVMSSCVGAWARYQLFHATQDHNIKLEPSQKGSCVGKSFHLHANPLKPKQPLLDSTVQVLLDDASTLALHAALLQHLHRMQHCLMLRARCGEACESSKDPIPAAPPRKSASQVSLASQPQRPPCQLSV